MAKVKNNNYTLSIVSYIDILGFSNFVCNSSFNEVLNSIKTFKKNFGSSLKYERELIGRRTSFCSDSFFATTPIGRGQFYHELHITAITQCQLIYSGQFLRGGITIGNVFHRGTNIFGNALVKAVDLEKDIEYPIIQIDNEALEYYKNNSKMWSHPKCKFYTFEDDFKFLRPIIGKTQDNKRFVDYLAYIFTEDSGGCSFIKDFMQKHKSEIITALSKVSDPHIREKYIWLKKYHNDTLTKNNVNTNSNLYIT